MKDKETILKLYDNFMDEIYTMTPENHIFLSEIATLEDKLNKTLTDQQKKILNKINELESQRVENVYKEVFVFAYSLATKLIVEGLDKEKE